MKQRDIILVLFPFSDGTGQKVRPALVLSNDNFNKKSEDVIICAITSNIQKIKYSILINNSDFEKGRLYDRSSIKIESIFKLRKSLIVKSIGTLKKQTFSKVIGVLLGLFRQAEN